VKEGVGAEGECERERALGVRSVCVYYCRTYYKAVRGGGEEESGGHVL
jgi:hypothetical protein